MKKIYLLFLLIFSTSAMAVDITPYEVTQKITKKIEIREYKDLLLATVSSGDNDGSFGTLFKFISGSNDKNEKIAMTAPVFEENINDITYLSFAMPEEFNYSNLPMPNDKSINIENIEKQKFIVIRFSGNSGSKNFAKHREILIKKIKEENINADLTSGINAYYNSPLALPPFRRNEILFRLI